MKPTIENSDRYTLKVLQPKNIFYHLKLTTMKNATKAILEIMSGLTEPIKFQDLIIQMYKKKKINVTHNHLSVLIARGKVERVSLGFYQLKKVS